MPVDRGHQEWRGTIAGTRLIYIGTSLKERSSDFRVAVTHGHEERAESPVGPESFSPRYRLGDTVALSFVHVLGRRSLWELGERHASALSLDAAITARLIGLIGRIPLLHVDHACREPWVGAFGEQRPYSDHLPRSSSEHEGCLSPRGLPSIRVGPGLHQGPYGRGASRGCSKVECGRLPRGRNRRGIGTGCEERIDDARVTATRREMDRGVGRQSRHCGGVRTGGEKDGGEFGVATVGSPVETGHAVPLRGVYLRPASEERPHFNDVTAHRGVRDR